MPRPKIGIFEGELQGGHRVMRITNGNQERAFNVDTESWYVVSTIYRCCNKTMQGDVSYPKNRNAQNILYQFMHTDFKSGEFPLKDSK